MKFDDADRAMTHGGYLRRWFGRPWQQCALARDCASGRWFARCASASGLGEQASPAPCAAPYVAKPPASAVMHDCRAVGRGHVVVGCGVVKAVRGRRGFGCAPGPGPGWCGALTAAPL
ncbi:hypothetical protein EVG20_g7806 [Dentipellis fragilis]|uniref:Uncharacterized protein n=1 Tax=Dentipellis fragilis TaxID=205917 RepID=A0A4Y9YA05_9AGAM|nr:hypothetical protein EVG20_g7806 [Dentipellis fragilis]